MEIIKELKSTYLSKPHFKGGKTGALFFLALCCLMSVIYWHHPAGDALLAKGQFVFKEGQYYRLITSLFIHGDLKHLLSNSLMLLLLSYYVIQYYGLVVFTLYSVGLGALINGLTLSNMAPEVGLLGASGVVYFLWGLWLSLYIFIERGVTLTRRIMKVVAITIFLLVPSSYDPQVSYLAHGVGFGVGLATGLGHFFWFKDKLQSFEHYQYRLEYDDHFPFGFGEEDQGEHA